MYGVEIAESMGVEKEMCVLAYELRKRIEEKIIDYAPKNTSTIRKSKYNSNVYLDECRIEGCHEQSTEPLDTSLDTHHIRHQSEANSLGQIDHFHKNDEHNLMGLCKEHHRQTHEGLIEIVGYQMTSNGEPNPDYDPSA